MLKFFVQKLIRMDFIILASLFFLLTWSIIFIHGIGVHCGGDIEGYWSRQIAWAVIGLIGMFIVASIDYRSLGEYSWLVYFAGVSLLVLVLVIGSEINGAKSWIKIPGATIQPAELAKPCALLMSAWLMSKRVVASENAWSIKRFIVPGLACAIPCFLVLIQPDLGSSFVFIPIFGAIAFMAGLSKRVLAVILIVITLTGASIAPGMPIYENFLSDYQQDRIDVFINPESDIANAGYNAYQSKLAVGSGGLQGKGLGQGTMYILGYLPYTVAPTDFIHSAIAEETGFVGSSILIFAYLLIILRAVHIMVRSTDSFGKFLAAGFIGFILTHCYINIGMTIGVAPVIGVPLPFVSYGGSFMVGCMVFMGLLQSVHVHRNIS